MDSEIDWSSFNKEINDIEIDFYPVSTQVNYSKNDDKSLIEPLFSHFYSCHTSILSIDFTKFNKFFRYFIQECNAIFYLIFATPRSTKALTP